MIVVSKTTRTLAKVLMQEARNVYIYGPPGSGKSEFCAEIAEELGLEYITVSFSGESSIDDLLGYMSLQQGESGVVTQPVDGALVKAAKRGCVLICEEIDAAPPSALIVLHKALDTRRDGSRSFYNPLSHETIEAKEGFCVWATANTAGSGDIDGRYAGTLIQNQAFLDRFYFLKFDYLNPRSEAALLKKLSGVDDTNLL
jgi:cobaltochelatase CobS